MNAPPPNRPDDRDDFLRKLSMVGKERSEAPLSSLPMPRDADPAWKAMVLKIEDLMRERASLLATLRQTLSFQTLAEAVSSAPDLEALLGAVAEVVTKILPWNSLSVHGIDPVQGVERVLLERGIGEDDTHLIRGWTEDGIVDWLLKAARPIVIPEGERGEGWVLVPLLVLGRAVGWLALRPLVGADEIQPHHLQTLALVGSQTAATLDNLSQMGRLQASLSELESLYDVGSRIGSSLDLGEIFQVAADALDRRFHPQVVQLAAVDAGHPMRLRALCARGASASDPSEDGILMAACRRAEPVQVRRSLGATPELDRLGVDFLVAVPFVHRGTTVLGGLVVGSSSRGELDRPDALNWLVALAGLLSASLENARLYDDLLGVNERLSAMQSRLVQAGRLAGIGSLAGGIAHEINNPLQVIMGRLQILQMRLTGNDKALEEVARVDHEVKRIARIVRGIQDFSHQSRENAPQERVRLVELCESTLQLLEHRVRKNSIQVERQGFELPLSVHGDPDQLRQVVLNLCLNAVQSMPDGGTLRLSLAREGDQAVFEIRDTGSGVAPEDVERIFDPFFTTHADSVGLGLAIGYAVCQRHGGVLELVPGGTGATFRMKLPALPERPLNLPG